MTLTISNRPHVRFFTVFLLALILLGCSRRNELDWVNSLPKPWTLSEDQISAILPEFQDHFPDFQERIKALAIWRVGTPYEIFKLGEEQEPDTDPIIRMDVSDCTGHILTTLAAAQSRSWEEARKNMIRIHYKRDSLGQQKPTYLSRWHYTADRITANPNTVNITESLLPKDELVEAHLILNRKSDGTEFLPLNWEREVDLFYIPNKAITQELMARLPEVCGVAFVRRSYMDKGILIAHEGMIIDRKDLIHASLSAGFTQRIPFLDYYFPEDGPFMDGIMIYTFQPLD
ncbi:MAG: DUF1460 domain-containing protein [FCB group bacterium]|nr:DUF1460 domain-containing protein [FCB group bacterium]